MAFGLLLPLRIAQGAFSIVVLGLSAYVAHWYDNDTLTASPSQINFLIFVPLFSFLSLVYLELTPRFLTKVSHPLIHLSLSLLTTLFYFAGFVALSVFLSKLLFCRGSVCAAARADAVFAAFSWMTWTASTALVAIESLRGSSNAMGMFKRGRKEDVKPMKEAGIGA